MDFTKTVTKIDVKKIILFLLVLGVVGWLLTYWGVRVFGMLKNQIRNNKLVAKANAEINAGEVTLTTAQVYSMADRLYRAMKGAGTDEDAIYSVFRSLRTRSDLMLLESTFGVRGGMSLSEWLTAELNQKERDVLNQILVSNGISYSYFVGV